MSLLSFLLLFIAGCSQMQANPGTRDGTAPAMGENAEQVSKDEPQPDIEPIQSENLPTIDSISVVALPGYPEQQMLTYKLNHWEIGDDWNDVGVDAEDIFAGTPSIQEGGGVLLATITLENKDADVISELEITINANALGVMTQDEIDRLSGTTSEPETDDTADAAQDETDSPDDQVQLLFENNSPAAYYDGVGRIENATEREYYIMSPIARGESVTYTLGFVLSPESKAAAETGELYLYYADRAIYSTQEIQLLHLYDN